MFELTGDIVGAGFAVSLLIPIVLFALGFLITYLWSWVDETEWDQDNYFINILTGKKQGTLFKEGWGHAKESSIWRYERYNERGYRIGYSDKSKDAFGETYSNKRDKMWVYFWIVPSVVWTILVITSVAPMFVLSIVMFAVVMRVARTARRAQRAIKAHIADVNAHKQVVDEVKTQEREL